MTPKGGTELLFNNFMKYVGNKWESNTHLFLSSIDDRIFDNSKRKILWHHLYVDQQNSQFFKNYELISKMDIIVFVSDWQKQQFLKYFSLQDSSKFIVIKNAIEPIKYVEKQTDKIKLIYTSMPNRGLEVLLHSFSIIDTKNVELDVFSSNIIYGKSYYNSIDNNEYEKLFHKCKTTKNINYRGYATNKGVRYALQSSNILSYPSIFPETSCLAAIEAGAAGCKLVTTNYGALPETCLGQNSFTEVGIDIVEKYASLLDYEIKNYDPSKSLEQSNRFNEYYSWDTRKKEWEELLYA